MSKIIFIIGPTATGKTDFAFNLAKKTAAEIISADSMLIYKEPEIITSKPPVYMRKRIKHHFINIISVEDSYDVASYSAQANKIIKKLVDQKTPVIVCGGTGLYIKVLLDGIFDGSSSDPALREKLRVQARDKGKDYIYNKLKRIDPDAAAKISSNDLRRVIRALEVYHLEGVPISLKQKQAKGLWASQDISIFGLSIARPALYQRINKRVDEMFDSGAVEEVKRICQHKLSLTASKIIGIKEISGLLEDSYSITQAKSLMSKNTRNFAKRQITWFKPDKRIRWIDVEGKSSEEVSKEILNKK